MFIWMKTEESRAIQIMSMGEDGYGRATGNWTAKYISENRGLETVTQIRYLHNKGD